MCQWWREETGTHCTEEQRNLLVGRSRLFRNAAAIENESDAYDSSNNNNGTSVEFPWLSSVYHCLQQERQSADSSTTQPQPDKEDTGPYVAQEYPSFESMEQGSPYAYPIAVQINNALTAHDAQRLERLQGCLQLHHPHMVEEREGQPSKNITGNTCTHTAGFLQWLLPDVASKVRQVGQMAYDCAKWKDYNPNRYGTVDFETSGYRTAEVLEYTHTSKGLRLHVDGGSLYTVLIMLSDPDVYEGGLLLSSVWRYSVLDGGRHIPTNQKTNDANEADWTLTIPKYTAMVFLAEENNHKVMEITAGKRKSFANEFWTYGNAPIGIMRPVPDMVEYFATHGKFEHDSWVDPENERKKKKQLLIEEAKAEAKP